MRALLVALPLAAGCVSHLRAADPAQATAGRPGEARAAVAGVSLVLRVGVQTGWLADVPPTLLPVEVAVHNGSGAPVRIQAADFALATAGRARMQAMEPGAVVMDMRTWPAALSATGPSPQPRGVTPVPSRAPPGASPLRLLYSWPGLRGEGSPSPDVHLVGPDPRPRPQGVLESGGSASAVVFFPVQADRLRAFDIEVTIEGEGGQALGTVRVPFDRAS